MLLLLLLLRRLLLLACKDELTRVLRRQLAPLQGWPYATASKAKHLISQSHSTSMPLLL